MNPLHWYEGVVTYVNDIDPSTGTRTATITVAKEGRTIENVQLDQNSNFQTTVTAGDKVCFYADSDATAKFGFKSADGLPHNTPIWLEFLLGGKKQGFQPGELVLSARGTAQGVQLIGDAGFSDKSKGSFVWLRNNGDGQLVSGDRLQRISVQNSSKSIDIQGTNIDIYAKGNLLTTHAINIDSSLTGFTTLNIGCRNPGSGMWLTRLTCDFDGAWSLGAFDPLLGIQLGGFAYNLLPKLPLGPFLPNTCKITSIPYASQVVVDPLGTAINGQKILIAGLASPIPNTLAAPAINIMMLAATVAIGAPLTEIVGIVSITGNTAIEGAFEVAGASILGGATNIIGNTLIEGNTSITGLTTLTAINFTLPALPPTVPVGLGQPPAQGYILAMFNGAPIKIPYYLGA